MVSQRRVYACAGRVSLSQQLTLVGQMVLQGRLAQLSRHTSHIASEFNAVLAAFVRRVEAAPAGELPRLAHADVQSVLRTLSNPRWHGAQQLSAPWAELILGRDCSARAPCIVGSEERASTRPAVEALATRIWTAILNFYASQLRPMVKDIIASVRMGFERRYRDWEGPGWPAASAQKMLSYASTWLSRARASAVRGASDYHRRSHPPFAW